MICVFEILKWHIHFARKFIEILLISQVHEHFVPFVMKLYHEFVYLEKKDKHPSQK